MNDSHQIYITINLQQTKGKMSSHLPFHRNGKSITVLQQSFKFNSALAAAHKYLHGS